MCGAPFLLCFLIILVECRRSRALYTAVTLKKVQRVTRLYGMAREVQTLLCMVITTEPARLPRPMDASTTMIILVQVIGDAGETEKLCFLHGLSNSTRRSVDHPLTIDEYIPPSSHFLHVVLYQRRRTYGIPPR